MAQSSPILKEKHTLLYCENMKHKKYIVIKYTYRHTQRKVVCIENQKKSALLNYRMDFYKGI